MQLWLADAPFFGGPGQGTRQIIELFAAFGLTALFDSECVAHTAVWPSD